MLQASNCLECAANAEGRNLPQGRSCQLTCAVGLYSADGSACAPCDNTCASCDGPTAADCLSCKTAEYGLPVLSGGTCLAACPAGSSLNPNQVQ